MIAPRLLPVAALAVLLATAGCLGAFGGAPDSAGHDPPPPAGTPVPGPREYPSPPANRSADAVTAVALAHEEAFVYNSLANASGVDDFDVGASTVDRSATVLNRSDGGVYVRVVQPYWLSWDDNHADGATRAVYYVNAKIVRRVNVTREVSLP